MKQKILFLYTELAGYTLACMEALANEGAEILVIHWPENKEAPYKFNFPAEIEFVRKDTLSASELEKKVLDFGPDKTMVSGWVDNEYLKVLQKFPPKCINLLALDNTWTGKFKQQINRFLFKATIGRLFKYCWVPGDLQEIYASKLGFSKSRIMRGVYVCDTPRFSGFAQKYIPKKTESFPHIFLFVGRYVEAKGIRQLWDAFSALSEEMDTDWELWCLGTGTLENEKPDHPRIKHFGFVQPDEIESYIARAGVFVLPSLFEPWGVAVQEFACAGFPLLLSNKVGAATRFLEDGVNGFTFNAAKLDELKNVLRRVISLPDTDLVKMAKASASVGVELTPTGWANQLLKLEKN